jgi:hypothetical protein
VWSKNSNGTKSRGLGFCPGSVFEWASPTQRQRLQSCFHEVMDYTRIQDTLGAPTRLCHRNGESRTLVAKRLSGGGEPGPERSDQGSARCLGRRKGDTRRDRSPPGSNGTGDVAATAKPDTILGWYRNFPRFAFWLSLAVVPMMQTAESRLSDLSLPKMLSGANAFGDAFTRLIFALAQSWRKTALHTWRSSP